MHKQGHNLGMQYNASFQKYLARGIDLSDLEAVRLILAGNSVVDWNRANFHKKEDVDRFFALHLLDLNDPFDQRRLNFLYTESIGYLETHLKLRFPDDIRNPHDIRDIFLQASKDIGFNRRRVLSCTVLKLMHVLQHLDAAELRHRLSLSEAKILEVSLNDGFQSGIQWNTFGAGRKGTIDNTTKNAVGSMASELLTNPDNIGGVFNINMNYENFTGVIELLETQGTVKVLSSPRIATVNNQKAVIKVGNDEYFVTEIKSPTTSTGSSTTSFPEVIFTPFFSGIALDVTPQISEGEDVILHVHPTITEVSERLKNIQLSTGNLTVPLAFSTVRETDSIIRAKSGQVVVIGGLMQNQKRTTSSGIPYLRDIPIIGALFGQNRETIVQSELVILIQPRVVDSRFHYEEMERINERFSGLNTGQQL